MGALFLLLDGNSFIIELDYFKIREKEVVKIVANGLKMIYATFSTS